MERLNVQRLLVGMRMKLLKLDRRELLQLRQDGVGGKVERRESGEKRNNGRNHFKRCLFAFYVFMFIFRSTSLSAAWFYASI